MKAQRSFGLALSWPRVTAVFLVDVLILAVASHCRIPGRPIIMWRGGSASAWRP